MNIRSLTFTIVLFTLFFSGCATQGLLPRQQKVEKTQIFNASYDEVWAAIIGSIAETNLNISTLEKDSGLVAINGAAYSPEQAHEGTRGSVLGVPDQVIERKANMNIFATSLDPEKTKVRVNVSMKMNIRTGNGSQAFPFNYGWFDAYSNGKIERFVFNNVASNLSP